MSDPELAASGRRLTKSYGTGSAVVTALDGLDVDIPAGALTAIMGPSGSGKSTLMHCLAGLDQPDSGQVLLGGTTLESLSDDDLTRVRRTELGFVFQAFNLVSSLSARENILLPVRIAGRPVDEKRLSALADALGIANRLDHRPTQLSGGQQQRVAIARALITSPRVVFADEPTGNLDSRSSAEILRLLRRMVDELGQTVVLVTHDPVAAAIADQVLFLTDGRMVDVLRHPTPDTVGTRLRDLTAAREV